MNALQPMSRKRSDPAALSILAIGFLILPFALMAAVYCLVIAPEKRAFEADCASKRGETIELRGGFLCVSDGRIVAHQP